MPLAVTAAIEYWMFSTVKSAIKAVMHQVDYGWLPEEWITVLLASGMLKTLALGHGTHRGIPLHLIVRRALSPLDEQVKRLLTLFRCTSRSTPQMGRTE